MEVSLTAALLFCGGSVCHPIQIPVRWGEMPRRPLWPKIGFLLKYWYVQVTAILAARSEQRREAAVHHQMVLLARAMQAWFSWLGMHLAHASAKQERLLLVQVSCRVGIHHLQSDKPCLAR